MNEPLDLSGAWHDLVVTPLDELAANLVPSMNLLGGLIVAYAVVTGFRWRRRFTSGSPHGSPWLIWVGLFLAGPGLVIPFLLSVTDIIVSLAHSDPFLIILFVFMAIGVLIWVYFAFMEGSAGGSRRPSEGDVRDQTRGEVEAEDRNGRGAEGARRARSQGRGRLSLY